MVRSKYKVNAMLIVTCNYRIKETKPFAFIYFSTNATWQTAVGPVPFTIQNTDQQYSQTSSRTSPSSVSFKKVKYAQYYDTKFT